jgi:hypothetical protein
MGMRRKSLLSCLYRKHGPTYRFRSAHGTLARCFQPSSFTKNKGTGFTRCRLHDQYGFSSVDGFSYMLEMVVHILFRYPQFIGDFLGRHPSFGKELHDPPTDRLIPLDGTFLISCSCPHVYVFLAPIGLYTMRWSSMEEDRRPVSAALTDCFVKSVHGD